MIFTHQKLVEKVGVFNIKSQEKALANKVLNTKTLKEFWHSFTYKTSSIEIEEVSEEEYLKNTKVDYNKSEFECNKENDYRPDICSLNGYYLTEENIFRHIKISFYAKISCFSRRSHGTDVHSL